MVVFWSAGAAVMTRQSAFRTAMAEELRQVITDWEEAGPSDHGPRWAQVAPGHHLNCDVLVSDLLESLAERGFVVEVKQ